MQPASKLRWCVLAALTLQLLASARQEPDRFAGNLDPQSSKTPGESETKKSDQTPSFSRSVNHTEVGDGTAYIVSASDSSGSNGIERQDADADLNTEPKVEDTKKKAPRPPEKAKSVGFIPVKEEEEKKEDEIPKIDRTVRLVPELPPSIIKPGHMINGSWFIVLYAKWCQYSQAALSEFIPTIQYIVDHNITEIVVGKIDITKHNEVAKHFHVKSTPTILYFRNGFRFTFDHPIVNHTNLINFMLEILACNITEVNTTSELAAFQKNHDAAIFLIVHDQEIDQDWQRIFERQANDKCLKAKFALTTKPEIAEKYDLKTLPSILVLKDDTAVVFKQSLTAYSLSKWILLEKDKTFPTVNTSTLRLYLQPVSGRRLAFLAVGNDPQKFTLQQKQAIEVVKKIAVSRKLHQKYQFCLVTGETIPKMLLRRDIGKLPLFFAFEPYTGYYYLLQPDEKSVLSEERVHAFLQDIISGKEEPQGGVTFADQLIHLYQLGYSVFQSMIVHKPYLSMFTGLCVLGVICFYTTVCWQNRSNRLSAAEIRTKRAIRAQRKKEELAKRELEAAQRRVEAKEIAVMKVRDSSTLRKREGKGNPIKEDTESEGNDNSQSGSEQESQTER